MALFDHVRGTTGLRNSQMDVIIDYIKRKCRHSTGCPDSRYMAYLRYMARIFLVNASNVDNIDHLLDRLDILINSMYWQGRNCHYIYLAYHSFSALLPILTGG